MSPWLAIDTATDRRGLALATADELLAETTVTVGRRAGAGLAPAVASLLAAQGLAAAELGGVAVAIGPGGYTGLRAGLALAKGLALAADLPLVGVPTLDILATALSPPACPRDRPLWAALRAGRGRLVLARYPVPKTAATGRSPVGLLGGPEHAALRARLADDWLPDLAPGDWLAGELEPPERERFAAAGLQVLPPAAGLRRAGWLAALGLARFAAEGPADLAALEPVYLGAGV